MRPVRFDPRTLLGRKSQEDPRFVRVVQFLERDSEEWNKALEAGIPYAGPTNADGLYYQDTRQPFMIADQTAVTGTGEALLWPANYTSLVANYFTVGKMVQINVAGKITTAASSPGNLTLTARYGTTTGGTSLAASAATALNTSKTNITWWSQLYVVCRATGSGTSGSLLAWGNFSYDGAGAVFSTAANNPMGIPATAPAAVGVDTTSAQGIILDATLGSASDSMTVQYLTFAALN